MRAPRAIEGLAGFRCIPGERWRDGHANRPHEVNVNGLAHTGWYRMFPHFFGFDFSAALPWTLSGFLAGLFLAWIVSALRASRIMALADAKVAGIEAQLAAEKSEHQADVTRLLGDQRKIETALFEAEKRAADGAAANAGLSGEITRLSAAELATRNEVLAADAELGKLRGTLQGVEVKLRAADEAKQVLQSQITAFEAQRQSSASERQALTADLATARTAAELKDAEIARLINQVHWHEQRAAALEQEKSALTLGLTSLQSEKGDKTAEVFRLQDELGASRAQTYRIEEEFAGLTSKLTAAQSSYETAWKDLTYMRNLAYWQTAEIDRLRTLVTKNEDEIASLQSTLSGLKQQQAALKARLAGRGGAQAARRQALLFAHASNGAAGEGAGRSRGFVQRIPSLAAKKLANAKAYRPGRSIIVAAGRGAGAIGEAAARLPAFAARRRGLAQKAAPAISPGEVAALRAQVSALSADAANYRLLREALDTANRIAGSSGTG